MPSFKQNKRTNKLNGVENLIVSWDKIEENPLQVKLFNTKYGNINSTGILGNYQGDALSRLHPQFYKSLESGISSLVIKVIETYNWITYTSCEGHFYRGIKINPVERHIGLLPRNQQEHDYMFDFLTNKCKEINCVLGLFFPIKIDLVLLDLYDDEYNKKYPVIDIFFHRKWYSTWSSYFKNIDVATNIFIRVLGLM